MKNQRFRVLFIYPNERHMSTIPPAIALLSQMLKNEGHLTELFDTTFYEFDDEITLENSDANMAKALQTRPVKDIDDDDLHFEKNNNPPEIDLRKKIKDFMPDLLAVSCSETTFARGLKLIQKTRDLGVRNIFGGVFPTFAPQLVIKHLDVDMLCVGEGENALIDLANKMSKNEDFNDVTNLWIRMSDGSIKKMSSLNR